MIRSRMRFIPERIVSGAQTGVDRAALDAALEAGLRVGGWCPKGRRAEDGPIPDRYPVVETTADDYAVRTELNVRDSDATLVLCPGEPAGGTAFTIATAADYGRPCLVVDPWADESLGKTIAWLKRHRPEVLNVAGPRESSEPGIGDRTRDWLARLFAS